MWSGLMVNDKWNLKSYFIYFKNSHLTGYIRKLKISNLQKLKKLSLKKKNKSVEQEWS